MPSLVVGSTSQLARYFPRDFVRISSRDMDLDSLSEQEWDEVYICFAEQRTYLANSDSPDVERIFHDTNVVRTMEVIDALHPVCRKIVYYSTAELWNATSGPVAPSDPYTFHENHYTKSKSSVSLLLRDKVKYPKVTVAHPFNFNSVHRGGEYLFGKIFRSIVTESPVTIGDVDYHREILHPTMVVKATLDSTENDPLGTDIVIGSGRLVHVGDFIRKLYLRFGMDMDKMAIRDPQNPPRPSIYRKCLFYSHRHDPRFSEEAVINLLTYELSTVKEFST